MHKEQCPKSECIREQLLSSMCDLQRVRGPCKTGVPKTVQPMSQHTLGTRQSSEVINMSLRWRPVEVQFPLIRGSNEYFCIGNQLMYNLFLCHKGMVSKRK